MGVGKVSVLSPEEIAAEITAQDSAPTGQMVETGSEMAKVVKQSDFGSCKSYSWQVLDSGRFKTPDSTPLSNDVRRLN